MFQSNASNSPSLDWRRRDERAKEISTLGSWRERSGSTGSSNGSAEKKETSTLNNWRDRSRSKGSSNGSGEPKELSGDWRVRRQKTATKEDLGEVYGYRIPPESQLQMLYKNLKVDTNRFLTWLVEAIYPCPKGLPCSESLPPYVNLAPKQGKGEPARSCLPIDSHSSTTTDHPKYEIIVNNTTDLARRIQEVPLSILDLLERTIKERTEYSHWMSLKHTDSLAHIDNEKHLYYIEVLKEVKNILAERMESGRIIIRSRL